MGWPAYRGTPVLFFSKLDGVPMRGTLIRLLEDESLVEYLTAYGEKIRVWVKTAETQEVKA